MDAVMTNALGNIHNAQQEDIAQMKQGITELHKDQAKFREEMLAHLKDIKDVQARNDACHAAEKIAQIALEDGGDASKSMQRMRPHVRSLASSMKSTSLTMAYDKLKFDEDQLPLGSGAFGEVRVAEYQGTLVAVKQSLHGENISNASYMELMREAELWKDIRHPNIVLLMGIVPKPLCIVLEKMDTCLHKMIHEEHRVFTEGDVCQVADQVAQALMFLHAKSIIHRDVKPQNILANESLHIVKVTDFGLSTMHEESARNSGVGTPVIAPSPRTSAKPQP